MSYTPTVWKTGDVISSAKLNKLENGVADKQDQLTFDNTPTANSTNPVSSGGVYTEITELKNDLMLIGAEEKTATSDWVIGGLKQSMAASASETNRCRIVQTSIPMIPDKDFVYVNVSDDIFVKVGVYSEAKYSSLVSVINADFASGKVMIPSEYAGKYVGFNAKKSDNSDFTQEECDALASKITVCVGTRVGNIEDLLTNKKDTVVDAVNALAERITDLTNTIDNGTLCYDSMGIGETEKAKSRLFKVDKNFVQSISTGGTSQTTAYCFTNLFGTPEIYTESWNSIDLSSHLFVPINIDGSISALYLTIVWGQTYDTIRNSVLVATRNPETGIISKARITTDLNTDMKIAKISLFDILPEIITNGNIALYMLSRHASYPNSFRYWLTIEHNVESDKDDIIADNSDAIDRIMASNWWSGERVNKPTIINLLHFSDVHGKTVQLNRIISMAAHLKEINLLDDIISTGDQVEASNASGMSFWTNTEGTAEIMLVVGNHDAYRANTSPHGRLTMAEKYSAYFGNVSNWDVTIPDGATYYYKDYPDAKVRLIVLDTSLEDADAIAQTNWLITTLSSAIDTNDPENNLDVIIAAHYIKLNNDTETTGTMIMDNNWSNTVARANAGTPQQMNYEFASTDVVECVSDFISNGGSFICYLIGHTHTDILSYPVGHSEQLIINVGTATQAEAATERANISNDLPRVADTRTQDLFNLITIDPGNKLLKVVRVGANINRLQRSRRGFCWDYQNHLIVGME